jgi:protein-tyrosine-phosphatase
MTEVIIHFICRGNSFRSILAEAYLNSQRLNELRAVSSGTKAAEHRPGNLTAYTATLRLLAKKGIRQFAKADYGDQVTQSRLAGADVVVCMNQRVYDECQHLVTLPAGTHIWSVNDIGEPGRIARTDSERNLRREEVYREIVEGVSQLIAEVHQGNPSGRIPAN